MKILQHTHKRFQEGVRVRVVRVETLTTMWVRLEGEPRISEILSLVLNTYPLAYWPKKKDLKPGMLVAVRVNSVAFWDRAILLQQTEKGYIVFLIDFGIETYRSVSSIRLLPRKLARIVPWARKLQLSGVRDQADQTLRHRVAQFTMLRRSGYLTDINSSPGDAMTARLVLDGKEGEFSTDMGAHWLELGYLDPE